MGSLWMQGDKGGFRGDFAEIGEWRNFLMG